MISKELVDLLILKRNIRLDEIIIDLGLFYRDEEGRIIPNLNKKDLLKKLDSLIYTLDFLLNTKKYIEVSNSCNLTGLSFHGYAFPQDGTIIASHIIYVEEYLSSRLGESYTIKPPLFEYRERNYRTQIQKQSDDNFRTAISSALLASASTAVLTALFSKWLADPLVNFQVWFY